MPPISHKNLATVLFVSAICILAVLVYRPGLSGDFALDDYTNVVQNPAIAIQDLSWDSLSHAAFSFQAGPAMRPLSMVSFALNAYFTGSDGAGAFKATNLAIHLLNGLLVFWLLSQLADAYRRRYAPDGSTERFQWFAIATGAVWLLHPLNVMPVLYVVQRETALSSLFVLLGVNLYIRTRARQLAGRGPGWPIWIGVPLLTLSAALCKESGTLLLVYALVVECYLFRFRGTSAGLDRGLLLFYAVFLFLPGCAGLIWVLTAYDGGFLNYAGRDFNLMERLMTETRVVWDYLRWTIAPDAASLGLYHDDIAVSRSLLAPVTTLFATAGIAALVAVCVLLRRRLPLVALGIAWFLGGQLMESTIFPLELAFEHRCYLPDLGLLLAASSLLFPLHARARGRLVRYTVFALAVAACAALTWVRANDWRDNLSFAQSEARHHPDSPYATYMLGQTYANLALMTDANQYDNAVASLKAASAVTASTIIPDVSLVLVETQIKKHLEAGVLETIAAKLGRRKISASDIQGLSALVDCVDKDSCMVPTQGMQAIFDSALANPHLDGMRDTHANILVIYGNYISARKPPELAKARELMAQAAQLVPSEPQYRMNLVTMDINLGERMQAEHDLDGLRRMNYLGHLDKQIGRLEADIEKLPAPGR
jgi:hypothetical protein